MKWSLLTFLIFTTLMKPTFTSALMSDDSANQADTIFVNGDIYTQATPARAQAIAVGQGKIISVGSNEEILKLKQKNTQVVDLGGHFVMPGFNDAHVHLASGGFEKMNVNLVGSHVAAGNAASHRVAGKPGCPGRVDRGPRLGPHAVAGADAADAPGHRRDDERASGDLRAGRWTHRHRQHGSAQGSGHHRPDRRLPRVARSITMRKASPRVSFARARRNWCWLRCLRQRRSNVAALPSSRWPMPRSGE